MNSSSDNGMLTDKERTLDHSEGSNFRRPLQRNSGATRIGEERGVKEDWPELDQRAAEQNRMRKR